MTGIYERPDLKPTYPSEGEMMNRLKHLELKYRDKEMGQLIDERARQAPFLGKERESLASRCRLFERRLAIFFKDLDCFVGFCLARYIVWREMRRERSREGKGAGQEGAGQE